MNGDDLQALRTCSRDEMTAIDPRRRPGGATFGQVLTLLGDAGLPAARAGRRAAGTDLPRPGVDVPHGCRVI